MSLRDRISSSKRGYTLIEMTVVITLIALFATLVMPALANWRAGDEYRAFPGKLLRFVATVKQDAIDNQQSRSLGFDATTGEFHEFWTDPTSNQQQEGPRLAPPTGVQLGRLVYLDNDTSPQNWTVTFYPNGTAERSGFELRDQDKYITIAITDSGQITLSHDALPEPDTIRWQAGENEVRSQ